MILLAKVRDMLSGNGHLIENIDATIIAQAEDAPLYRRDEGKFCETLELDPEQVNVKATTEEGLGFTGSGEGIAAQAVCALSSVDDLYSPGDSAGGCAACPHRAQ